MQSYHFVPLAFETMGPIRTKGQAFLADLGHHLAQISGDRREASFLFQHLTVVIQHFNSIVFHGTFVSPETREQCVFHVDCV